MPDQHAPQLRRAGRPLPAGLLAPHPDRLDHKAGAAAIRAHGLAVADGADGYIDPTTGLFSFTAAYHWAKGYCCQLGCRHCPWVDADQRIAAADDVA